MFFYLSNQANMFIGICVSAGEKKRLHKEHVNGTNAFLNLNKKWMWKSMNETET